MTLSPEGDCVTLHLCKYEATLVHMTNDTVEWRVQICPNLVWTFRNALLKSPLD